MMTGASIGAGQAAGYSAYLESRTVAPSRGDYYLSPAGEPTETSGVWHVLEDTRERLGLEAGEADGGPSSRDRGVHPPRGRGWPTSGRDRLDVQRSEVGFGCVGDRQRGAAGRDRGRARPRDLTSA